MADSTAREIAARHSRQDRALDEAMVSAAKFDFFGDALTEYMTSGAIVDSLHDDESGLLSIATVLNWHARNMVIAIADYLAAHAAFATQKALIDLDREEV